MCELPSGQYEPLKGGWKQTYEDVVAENHKICETLDKLRLELAEKNEEIELQNIILNPGEHINEQKRGDETILVLTKGKWFIQSMRERDGEIAALKATRVALTAEIERLRGRPAYE